MLRMLSLSPIFASTLPGTAVMTRNRFLPLNPWQVGWSYVGILFTLWLYALGLHFFGDGSSPFNAMSSMLVMALFTLVGYLSVLSSVFMLPRWMPSSVRNLATLSCFIFLIGAVALSLILKPLGVAAGVDSGWTFYAPHAISSDFPVDLDLALLVIAIFAGFLAFALMIVKLLIVLRSNHDHPEPGRTLTPLNTVWLVGSLIMFIVSLVVLLTFAAYAAGLLYGYASFDANLGGDPLLFQFIFAFVRVTDSSIVVVGPITTGMLVLFLIVFRIRYKRLLRKRIRQED